MNTIKVPASRLAWSSWPKPGGDIAEAYSGDKIGERGSKIRKPFAYGANLYCTVGGGPGPSWDAYRLVPIKSFDGKPTTYAQKVCGERGTDYGESARNDPLGFYHGMTVKHGRDIYVLVGPEVSFVGDESAGEEKKPGEQLELWTPKKTKRSRSAASCSGSST